MGTCDGLVLMFLHSIDHGFSESDWASPQTKLGKRPLTPT